MNVPWINLSPGLFLMSLTMMGIMSGYSMAIWSEKILLEHLPNWSPSDRKKIRLRSSIAGGFMFSGYLYFVCGLKAQIIPEVQPSEFGRFCQIVFHLSLITLLLGVTITDLWDYAIMDQMILVGIILGLGGQFVSGELQIQHLWIDWNAEQVGIKGPDVPDWIDHHRHWHGLLVGLAGLITGAGITWGVRSISSKLLGAETMGFGDVTLMAMIGSYLGWQPVLFVLALAPLTGVIISLAQRMMGGKGYVPFGPFLALACYVVLCSWATLWPPLRYVFGHAPSLLGLIGGAAVAFVVLLSLLRLYRTIPVRESERYSNPMEHLETKGEAD